jgi:hypothetical protein
VILLAQSFKMAVDLVQEILLFKILKGEVVELKDIEVSLNIPWVLVLLKFPRSYLAPQVTDYLVNQARNVKGKQIDHFVYYGGTSVVMDA